MVLAADLAPSYWLSSVPGKASQYSSSLSATLACSRELILKVDMVLTNYDRSECGSIELLPYGH